MAYDVDFFVIGAGSGGVRAGRVAAQHGAKTMVAEEFRPGGTCVIRGCVPKKLYVYASRFADDFRDAEGFGWRVGETRFDWGALVAAKEREITRLSSAYSGALAKAGAELVRERARLRSAHEVELTSGKRVSARHILVATGGRPTMRPAIEGLDLAISSNEIFDLKRFPDRLLVVGSGYIAVEFASLFAKLGSAVTMAMRADMVLRGFDEDLRRRLGAALAHNGVALKLGRLPTRIFRSGGALGVTLSDGETLEVDEVLVATGREPNTKGLGLEEAGVALAENGGVRVDENLTSSAPSVHAVGDVSSRIHLTPVAIREGHALADRLFGAGGRGIDYDKIPTAVFTTPEIGTIGLTEADARRRFNAVDIYQTEFRPMRATLGGGPERTFLKLVVDGETGRLLGGHFLGESSAEIVQTLAIAFEMGATKDDLDRTMALHPSVAEELVTMRTPHARHRATVKPHAPAH